MGYYFGVPMNAKDFRIEAAKKCKPLSNKLCLITLIYIAIFVASGTVGSLTSLSHNFLINNFNLKLNYNWLNSIVSLVISGPLLYGLISVNKEVYNDSTDIAVSKLFIGFTQFSKTFVIQLLVNIFTFLWSLLFVIPGIIKGLSYSMSMYIYYDNPTLSPKECINMSKKMMKGHKWDLFCLMLSYIGWIILSILTLGILLLWVMPKMQQAQYIFYQYVSGKMKQENTENLEF